MFSKVLVANRGEIAVRAFRAAREIGARTVAVFPHEDRGSEHRMKAEEAYQIGEVGHPVRAYLDPQAIVDVAVQCGADAIYPGYGFLSENPALAEACAAAGITFIGPSAEVLTLTGNKARAIAAAKAAGVPVLESVPPSTDVDELLAAAEPDRGARSSSRPSPVAVGAACAASRTAPTCARPSRPACARPRARSATRPSSSSRPSSTPATSRCRSSSDGTGSEERGHPPLRARLLGPAPTPEGRRDRPGAQPRPRDPRPHVRRRRALRPRDRLQERRHRGVPARPRRQLRLHRDEPAHPGRAHRDRGGHRRRPRAVADADRGRRDPRRPRASPRTPCSPAGFALQCRITTEDPANGFRPDTGKITTYRSPGGPGVRLDGGTTYSGAEISPHFDSMLAKLTCRGRTFEAAVQKARRALAGVPHPRRLDQRRVPPGRARRP